MRTKPKLVVEMDRNRSGFSTVWTLLRCSAGGPRYRQEAGARLQPNGRSETGSRGRAVPDVRAPPPRAHARACRLVFASCALTPRLRRALASAVLRDSVAVAARWPLRGVPPPRVTRKRAELLRAARRARRCSHPFRRGNCRDDARPRLAHQAGSGEHNREATETAQATTGAARTTPRRSPKAPPRAS